jgi:hypothetical protein
MAEQVEAKGSKVFLGVMAGLGGAFGIWALMAFITGLASTNWQVTEMMRNFLIATNNIGEYDTLVDFYTHIKGVEYLMAGAFFVAFPIYFKYVNKAPESSQVKAM